ncbi:MULTISPECIES: cell division protein DivIVA [unclassified Methylobacterium]|uniref:cell division protein DivIVA n=2 Tax=Methylobacterium TaxID=407 RepID=UPI001FB96CFD|nr:MULTISPECIES: cell division protein DivIVA [unclassified Methylobacterium]MCJ2019201.1 cell division protein DivIVA [Methylobacterium sp. E-065]MCJ2065031.1 cell division protein DivIVA [Methylobacterium sp. J-088]
MSMIAAPTASWSHILTQVAESLDRISEKPSAEILRLKPSSGHGEMPALRLSLDTDEGPAAMMPEPAVNDAEPVAAPTMALSEASMPSSSEAQTDAVADWMTTLDIINGMVGLADEQKKRLREQSASHEVLIETLQRELKETQQRLQLSEMRSHEIQTRADIRLQRVQADADSQVEEIRAEAEARVRTLQAEAEAWVRAAEEQVRVADLRAYTAEKWLSRIDAAAKTLLLGGHMGQVQFEG